MENRLKLIYDAACDLFINKGYSRTQIKDIAKNINLSTGMMYIYFNGKKDILDFTLKATIQPDFLDKDVEFPLDADYFKDINKELLNVFKEQEREFASALNNEVNKKSFEKMLSQAFDLIYEYGKGILIIEKNPDDVGVILNYYLEHRKRFFLQMFEYMETFQSKGICRKLEHTEYSTQLIIETLSWWGMHTMNDAFSPNKDISVEAAKKVCMDNLTNAYLE